MSKQVLIFHGTPSENEYYSRDYPALSNGNWLPWLQQELQIAGYAAHTPEVFESYKPTYEKWLTELERYQIDKNTSLVGHSCGAGFLIRWLSENPEIQVGNVVLVAPWLNSDGYKDCGTMFDFDIDPRLGQNTKHLVIYHSDKDMPTIEASLQVLRDHLPDANYREFKGYGHFCIENMHTEEFPELLEDITK